MRNWDIVKGMRFIAGGDGDARSEHRSLGEEDCVLLINRHNEDICNENDGFSEEKLRDKIARTMGEELFKRSPYEDNHRPLVVMPLRKNKDLEFFLEFLNLPIRYAGRHGTNGEPYGYLSWYIGIDDVGHMGDVVGNLVDMALESKEMRTWKTIKAIKRRW